MFPRNGEDVDSLGTVIAYAGCLLLVLGAIWAGVQAAHFFFTF